MRDTERLPIGTWPTPVRRLDRVSEVLETEVWMKVEEGCGAWGGNKVRKLEMILAEAKADGIQTLVSSGAGTSNWTSALAHHATRQGFRVVIGLAGREVPDHYERLYETTGTEVVRVPRLRLMPLALARARWRAGRGKVRVLPPGGSGSIGDLGALGVGREIAASIEAGELPRPAKVFVAFGTGGTTAGTAVGLGAAGLRIPVVAVRVVDWPIGTERHVRRSVERVEAAARAAGLLRGDRAAAPVEREGRFAAPGYAQPNDNSREAERIALLDEIELDPTYAAKAFAGLIAAAREGAKGPFLLVHTSPGLPPQPQTTS